MPEWCDRESGGLPAPEERTNEGHGAVRGNHSRASERSDALLNSELNAGFKRGEVTNGVVGSYHCHSTPRSKVALS